MKILVKIPFIFTGVDGKRTYYKIGLQDVPTDIAFHQWVLAHASVVQEIEPVPKPKKVKNV